MPQVELLTNYVCKASIIFSPDIGWECLIVVHTAQSNLLVLVKLSSKFYLNKVDSLLNFKKRNKQKTLHAFYRFGHLNLAKKFPAQLCTQHVALWTELSVSCSTFSTRHVIICAGCSAISNYKVHHSSHTNLMYSLFITVNY